jgi:hypothetical protein
MSYERKQPAAFGWLFQYETLQNDTLGQSETSSQAAPLRARNVFERLSVRSTVTVQPR